MIKKIFNFTDKEIKKIKKEIKLYETPRSSIVEVLKIIQKNRGWISDESIKHISKILKISDTDVESVATFYNQIFRQKVGKYVIKYCDSVVCYINGCKKIQKKISKILNILPGQTTQDNKFTLLPICCLGNCDKGPSIMINDTTYVYLNENIIKNILRQYI